jgi:hypothetical protein
LVTKKDDSGWWEGEVNGLFGFFPCSYVAIILHISKQKVLVSDPTAVPSSPAVKASVAMDEGEDWSEEALLMSMAEQDYSQGEPRGSLSASPTPRGSSDNVALASLRRSLEAERAARAQLESTVASLQAMINKERESHSKLEELVGTLKDDVHKIKKQIHKQNKEAKSCSTPRADASSGNATGELLQIRKSDFVHLQSDCSTLRTEVDTLRAQCDRLEEELRQQQQQQQQPPPPTASRASLSILPRVALPLVSLPPPKALLVLLRLHNQPSSNTRYCNSAHC